MRRTTTYLGSLVWSSLVTAQGIIGGSQDSCTSKDAFQYLACFSDSNSGPHGGFTFQLSPNPTSPNYFPGYNDTMTPLLCQTGCRGHGYKYAGLEYQTDCYCSTSVPNPSAQESTSEGIGKPLGNNPTAAAPPSACHISGQMCSGNPSQFCGSSNAMDVYQDPTISTDPDDRQASNFLYLACLRNDPPGPFYAVLQTTSTADCAAYCGELGYPYMGRNGFDNDTSLNSCGCSSELRSGVQVDDSYCNFFCDGGTDADGGFSSCGGQDRHSAGTLYWSVWQNNAVQGCYNARIPGPIAGSPYSTPAIAGSPAGPTSYTLNTNPIGEPTSTSSPTTDTISPTDTSSPTDTTTIIASPTDTSSPTEPSFSTETAVSSSSPEASTSSPGQTSTGSSQIGGVGSSTSISTGVGATTIGTIGITTTGTLTPSSTISGGGAVSSTTLIGVPTSSSTTFAGGAVSSSATAGGPILSSTASGGLGTSSPSAGVLSSSSTAVGSLASATTQFSTSGFVPQSTTQSVGIPAASSLGTGTGSTSLTAGAGTGTSAIGVSSGTAASANSGSPSTSATVAGSISTPSVSIVTGPSSSSSTGITASLGSSTSVIPGGTTSTSSSSSSATSSCPRVAQVAGWSYIGCYGDRDYPRVLNGSNTLPGTDPTLTNEDCAAACSGYTYFGTEYGTECFCGNYINPMYSADASSDPSVNGCNMTCGINTGSCEYCGGNFKANIYQVGSVSPVAGATASSTATSISAGGGVSSATGQAAASSSGASTTSSSSSTLGTSSMSATASVSSSPVGGPNGSGSSSSVLSTTSVVGGPASSASVSASSSLSSSASVSSSSGTSLSLPGLISSAFGSSASSASSNTVGASNLGTSSSSSSLSLSSATSLSVSSSASSASSVVSSSSVSSSSTSISLASSSSTTLSSQSSSVPSSLSSSVPSSALSSSSSSILSSSSSSSLSSSSSPSPSSSSSIQASGSLSISSSATASSASSSPVLLQSSGNFTLHGCYPDPDSANYPTVIGQPKSTVPTQTSLEDCATFCASYQFAYFGVERSILCFCGNTLNSTVTPFGDTTECQRSTCNDANTEYCGGDDAHPAVLVYSTSQSVYSTGYNTVKSTSPLTVTSNATTNSVGYEWQGCWDELGPIGPPKLMYDYYNDTFMGGTVELCANQCALGPDNTGLSPYKYLGVEYGGQCSCGNSIDPRTQLYPLLHNCDTACSGDPTENCGGFHYMGVYQRSDTTSGSGALSVSQGHASSGGGGPKFSDADRLDVLKEYEMGVRNGLAAGRGFGAKAELSTRREELNENGLVEDMAAQSDVKKDQSFAQMGRRKPMPYVGPRGLRYSGRA